MVQSDNTTEPYPKAGGGYGTTPVLAAALQDRPVGCEIEVRRSRHCPARIISDCRPSEERAESKQNLWIIGIWVLFLEAS